MIACRTKTESTDTCTIMVFPDMLHRLFSFDASTLELGGFIPKQNDNLLIVCIAASPNITRFGNGKAYASRPTLHMFYSNSRYV